MKDWIIKLDDFIRFNERDLLTHAGKIKHQQAVNKAHSEYDKYRTLIMDEPTPIERHFIEAVKELETQSKK